MFGKLIISAATFLCWLGMACAEQPPTVAPQLDLKVQRGDASNPLRKSPNGNVELRLSESTAQLYDSTTKKNIGETIRFNQSRIATGNPKAVLKITCWAFSPDGKWLATGAGYKRVINGFEILLNEGEVRIWEVSSGRLLKTFVKETTSEIPIDTPRSSTSNRSAALGIVRGVAFSKDSKSVLIDAEPFEIDGR